MTTTTAPAPAALVAEVVVHAVTRPSPAFVRVELASPAFADLGDDGFDTRFKLVLPGPTGELPPIPPRWQDYYPGVLAMPDEVRAVMRTYTVRDVVRDGHGVRLVVDLVVHEDLPHLLGPACRWALAASPGDVVHVIAPHRLGEYGGTEFDPGPLRRLLLIGDETAVPAIARILEDLGPGYSGEVFLEVPRGSDILDLPTRPGIEVRWLPRGDSAYGRRVVLEVRRHLGLPGAVPGVLPGPCSGTSDVDVWETPRYSAAGEDVDAQLHTRALGHDLDDTYAWIAGESWMVKALRRSLVTDLGLDRAQVAFMGYWREGVAMR
jgi:NADPH-dependent ferric siderophore reductase